MQESSGVLTPRKSGEWGWQWLKALNLHDWIRELRRTERRTKGGELILDPLDLFTGLFDNILFIYLTFWGCLVYLYGRICLLTALNEWTKRAKTGRIRGLRLVRMVWYEQIYGQRVWVTRGNPTLKLTVLSVPSGIKTEVFGKWEITWLPSVVLWGRSGVI